MVIGISWFGVIWLAGFFHKGSEEMNWETRILMRKYLNQEPKSLGFPSTIEFSNNSTPKNFNVEKNAEFFVTIAK